MRVLLVAEQLRRRAPGGIGTYTRGLLLGLSRLGGRSCDVTLLASRRFVLPGREAGEDPVLELGRPLLRPALPGPLLTRAWDAGVLRAPGGFDLVHLTSLSGPRRGRAPLAVTVHDLAWREHPEAFPPRGRRWHEASLARALREADRFVVPSERTAGALVEAGAPAARVEVVEEGCDHLPPPDHGRATALLEWLGVGGEYLLAVGTLEPRKNLARLLEAYERARRSLPNRLPLVVVGPRGWGTTPVVPEGAVLAGHVDDPVLSSLYERARCVAYVPLSEGFGLPAVEAMAAGAPVVASRVPSTGGAALEVDPLDAGSICAGLVQVCTDDAVRSRLLGAGSRRARQLTWAEAARRHVEIWEALSGRGGRGHSLRVRPALPASRAADSPAGPVRVSLDVSAVPERPAGAGQYVLELARALSRREDVELSLVSRRGDGWRWEELAPGAAVEPVVPPSRPVRLAWEQARMPRLLSRLGVEVHHAPHYTMPEPAAVPTLVTIHDLTFFDHPEWHERSKAVFFRHAIRAACRRAAGIVCVSAATARRLRALLEPAAAVRVIHHGVDHSLFCPSEPRAGEDEARLSAVGVRPPYVAFVGTVEPRKDLPTLVAAFDRICAAHPGMTLVIAGLAGWDAGSLDRAIAASRHAGRIKRVGYLPRPSVPSLMRQSCAVVYPAVEEGFGLPALEAMACGAPLVTTSGSAMEEVADGAAVLVPPRDVEALAGAMDMVVRRDEGLAGRRERGLRAAARFTWEACAAAHAEAYASLREGGRSLGGAGRSARNAAL
jgi:glycosyltransferase involved in cell wall biosynthesis